MKRARSFARASIVALAGLVGCGIDALGTGTPDGGAITNSPSPSPSPTTTSTAPPDKDAGEVDATAPLATCKDLPATWGLVAVVAATDACPAGFAGGITELHNGATTRADTCTCGCAITAQPTCTRGGAGATYDNDNTTTCGLTSSYGWNPAANGGCSTDMWPGPYTTNHDWKFSAPSRTGGTCSSNTTKHTDRLDFATSARACVPTAGCDGAPAVVGPAKRCVISDGDVQCPNSTFTNRTLMGRTFDVTCSAGSCDCGITGTCGGGTMTFYANNDCTGSSFAMAASGSCVATTANNVTIASYKYTATLNGGGCTTTGAAAAAVATAAVSTICCE